MCVDESLDEAIEKQAKQNRKFDLNSVMSEIVGGGLGGSPVSRQKQIILELGLFIDKEMDDVFGALKITLKKSFNNEKVLISENLEDANFVLKSVLDDILTHEKNFFAFVKRVDSEYGRMFQERPMFQKPGEEARSGDVYTHESVRKNLEEFRKKIR